MGQYKTIVLEDVDSTNIYASNLIKNGTINDSFTFIRAIKQSCGRGQGDHKWESSTGDNLTFSIIFKPENLSIASICEISQATALGVADFIKSILIEDNVDFQNSVFVKWPNDVYVNDNKITGILIENVLKSNLVEYSVIGVGININQTVFSDNIKNPISLKSITGVNYNLEEIFGRVIASVLFRLQLIGAGINDGLYDGRLYRKNQWCKYIYLGKEQLMRICGVNEYGYLLVENKNGELLLCDLCEIKYII